MNRENPFTSYKNILPTKINKPFNIFITSGAGCGKSFLITTMIDWMNLCTSVISGISPVLVCVPTGVAASNIHGFTLHSTQ